MPPDDSSASTQTSYLYDLKKLIEKSKANIKEVNEKIKEQAVLKRNQKREERAREYYQKGMELTNEGKLDEAREYFEKAIRITEHPEMAGYIRDSQRRLRREEGALRAQENQHYKQIKQDESTRRQEVEEAYKEAVEFYKEKKYHPAKDAFQHVDELAPDYRATSSYLKIIDQDIIAADAIAAKQQAVEIARQQKEAEAARVKEKQMWLKQIEEKEKERKESINKQAAEQYDEAIDLYKHKKFAEAKKKFQEVSWVIPDFKATRKYLERIDRDAEQEKERVAEEQKKALEQQRWEEEVAKKKKEVEEQRQLKLKDIQHQKDIQEQAKFLYTAAVNLYDKKKMDEALEKFNEIEKLSPDFKSTRSYIVRIEQNQGVGKRESQPESPTQPQPAASSAPAPVIAGPAASSQTGLSTVPNQAVARQKPGDEAKKIYDQAMDSYRAHNWEMARAQFKSVEAIEPNYKHTRHYLDKVESFIARESKNKPLPLPLPPPPQPPNANPGSAVTTSAVIQGQSLNPPMPPEVKSAVTLEDQERMALEVAALAAKSVELYHQIAEIATDRYTVRSKRKLAKLEAILSRLKASEERLLSQMREAQWRRQQQENKEKLNQHRDEAEKLYQEALEFLSRKDYSKAKIKLLAVENIYPDYKATRHYLSRIDQDILNASSQAVTTYEEAQAEHLKALQSQADAQAQARAQQEQQQAQLKEQQEEAALETLAQKIIEINDALIDLSKTRNYDAMKPKFVELENAITALTNVKDDMSKQKATQDRAKELAQATAQQRDKILQAQRREDRLMHAYANAPAGKEGAPALSHQSSNADYFKRRDIMQEQNALFNEAVDRYEHKKFTQAKLLFGELADQHDRRAEPWLKKVDRAITQQLVRSQAAEERERSAFLEDQLKAQRQLSVIQDRERQRQKKLTEELERQKRLYEDTRLLQLRKEELLKTQERERQSQEAKRLRQEEENAKKAQALRFHRIENQEKPEAPAKEQVQTSTAQAAPAAPPAPPAPAAMTPQQVKQQVELSNQRKAFLEKKYEQDQKEKARQDRIKAAQEARQKRIEEKQKEKQRREDLRKQQEQQREEAKHRQEMEKEESQRQSQLDAQRQAVRKQLEDGVESMYQDALSLYQQGDYADAADRFKDVQDILPGYKRSAQYMIEARQKIGNPANVSVPPA